MLEHILAGIIGSLAYSLIGVLVFLAAFFVLAKLAPFNLHKEIEEDQNTALGIIIASVIIGLALIISAAVHG